MAKMDKEAAELLALLGLNTSRGPFAMGRGTASRIRLLHASTSSTANVAPKNDSERRRDARVAPGETRWSETARLRPGFDVRVVDIGPNGVLIEAPTRLHIGVRVELALFAADSTVRLDLVGTVRRCHVSGLNPITYRGALEFTQPIEIASLQPFLTSEALSA